jgi:antitoxin VapB
MADRMPSTVFTSNRSQAVRLPKAVAFPDDVRRVESRLLVPEGERWDDLFLNGPRASEDFLVGREQPAAAEREPF